MPIRVEVGGRLAGRRRCEQRCRHHGTPHVPRPERAHARRQIRRYAQYDVGPPRHEALEHGVDHREPGSRWRRVVHGHHQRWPSERTTLTPQVRPKRERGQSACP